MTKKFGPVHAKHPVALTIFLIVITIWSLIGLLFT